MAPSDTQFENLKKRVRDLEAAPRATGATAGTNSPWPTVFAGGALLVAILAWVQPQYSVHTQSSFNSSVDGRIDEKLKGPNEKLDQMSRDIAEIDGTLKAWAPFMTPQFFKKSVSLPDKEFGESLTQLKAVTNIASESKAEIPVKDISDVGKRTIALASGNSDTATLAWETTTALLQYRSILNSIATPPDLASMTKPYDTQYHLNIPLGYKEPSVHSSFLSVPSRLSAAADFIGQDFNANKPTGPAVLLIEGEAVVLDNMHLKNVALINVRVFYHGGPIQLENVTFLNCTFEVTPDTNGRQLAQDILTNPSVSLSAS